MPSRGTWAGLKSGPDLCSSLMPGGGGALGESGSASDNYLFIPSGCRQALARVGRGKQAVKIGTSHAASEKPDVQGNRHSAWESEGLQLCPLL